MLLVCDYFVAMTISGLESELFWPHKMSWEVVLLYFLKVCVDQVIFLSSYLIEFTSLAFEPVHIFIKRFFIHEFNFLDKYNTIQIL